MSLDTNNFDCRHINNGTVCEHLSPWESKKKLELTHICTCKALNAVIFPEYNNFGKITQELVAVKPLFHCPKMQEFRVAGIGPKVVACININDFTAWHHDQKL